MSGVTDRLHKGRIAPRTAAVFWRTRSLACHANGILHSLFGREPFLYDQLMHPLIPKVVLVIEPGSAVLRRENFAQIGIAGILNVLLARHFQVRIFYTADDEAIEMLELPAHRDLEKIMKFDQGAVFCLYTSPN